MIFEIIILFVAGIGAGIVTGFIGASAVMVVAPILILFLGFSPYVAIGVSLAIDVFASSFASMTYYKYKNLNLKKALILLVPALVAVVLGSYLSKFISAGDLSGITGLAIFGIGVGFLFRKSKREIKQKKFDLNKKYPFLISIFVGLLIGFIAGAFGAGGGIMILTALVFLLGYRVHVAIGTSVLLMVFIALFGAGSHFIYEPFSLWFVLIGGVGGILGAVSSAKVANLLSEKVLLKIVGIVLSVLGAVLFLKEVLWIV